MPVRDTIPPVELASDRRTVVPAEPAADLGEYARDRAADYLERKVDAALERWMKSRPGAAVDWWARGMAAAALIGFISISVAHELGTSKYEKAILGLIDVLEEVHPEARDGVRDVERSMRD